MIKRASSLLIMAGLLTGCVTSPTPQSEVIQAPKDRVFAYQKVPMEKSGTIFVTRDQGYSGAACFYGLWIDSILSARLDVAERAKFIVPIGEHVLKAGRDPNGSVLCGLDGATSTQRETIIREGETKYFRYILGADGVPDIQRTDQ
jgi:hypothetical protein